MANRDRLAGIPHRTASHSLTAVRKCGGARTIFVVVQRNVLPGAHPFVLFVAHCDPVRPNEVSGGARWATVIWPVGRSPSSDRRATLNRSHQCICTGNWPGTFACCCTCKRTFGKNGSYGECYSQRVGGRSLIDCLPRSGDLSTHPDSGIAAPAMADIAVGLGHWGTDVTRSGDFCY